MVKMYHFGFHLTGGPSHLCQEEANRFSASKIRTFLKKKILNPPKQMMIRPPDCYTMNNNDFSCFLQGSSKQIFLQVTEFHLFKVTSFLPAINHNANKIV